MPPCVCRRDPAVSSAAQTSPASLVRHRAVRPSYNNTRRAGTISGTICRCWCRVCVQEWAGRYGARHGAAMSHTHPPTHNLPLLACSSYKLCHSYTCKGFEIRSFVRQKRLPLMPNLFQPTLEVERQQTASMAPFRIIHTAAR